jgi:hypothetical protein
MQVEYAHLQVIQLTSPRQTRDWLVDLACNKTGVDLF